MELTDSLNVKDGTDRQSDGQGRNWPTVSRIKCLRIWNWPTVWRSRAELTDSLKVKSLRRWKWSTLSVSSVYVDGMWSWKKIYNSCSMMNMKQIGDDKEQCSTQYYNKHPVCWWGSSTCLLTTHTNGDTKNGGYKRQLAVGLRLILFCAGKGLFLDTLFVCQVTYIYIYIYAYGLSNVQGSARPHTYPCILHLEGR